MGMQQQLRQQQQPMQQVSQLINPDGLVVFALLTLYRIQPMAMNGLRNGMALGQQDSQHYLQMQQHQSLLTRVGNPSPGPYGKPSSVWISIFIRLSFWVYNRFWHLYRADRTGPFDGSGHALLSELDIRRRLFHRTLDVAETRQRK
jgi:hypothetical protein